MTFSNFTIEYDGIIYFAYLMELDTTGNLCIAFEHDSSGNQCKLYSSNFLTDKTWEYNASTQNTTVKMCCSFTDTNGDFYVYRMLDNTTSTEIMCFKLYKLTEDYYFSSKHIEVSETTPTGFTPYAISTNTSGSALVLSTNSGMYFIISNDGDIVYNETTNIYYYFNLTTVTQLQCANTNKNYGLGVIESGINVLLGYYYITNGNVFILILDTINLNIMSNLIDNGNNNNLFYYTDSNQAIYKANFNTETLTFTDTPFITADIFIYTCLKICNEDNYIFAAAEGIVYSINNTLYQYSSASDFVWCAISNIDINQNITMCACNDTGKYYTLTDFVPCFLENTYITILEDNKEINKKIELLKINDLIKINENEYKKINFIGSRKIDITQFLNVIRVLPKNTLSENLPYENLYLTSGHSLLFKNLKYANEFYNKNVYDNNIENYYKIMAQHCNLCREITKIEISNIIENNKYVYVYHFSLESENQLTQYAIYSNGVRAECMSYEYALKSNLNIIKN